MAYPDIVLVGAQRSGTASLWACLSSHDNVRPAFTLERGMTRGVKEICYFSSAFDNFNYDNYKAWFDSGGTKDQLTIDATADYFHSPKVPGRIHAVNPKAKIVICLRDPVERAWSHYQFEVNNTRYERLPFWEACCRKGSDECPERLINAHFAYLQVGHYAEHVQRWYDLFGKDNVYLVQSEGCWQDMTEGVYNVCQFLGLPVSINTTPKDFRLNQSLSKAEMPHSIRRELRLYYESLNNKFYELVGNNWGWQ